MLAAHGADTGGSNPGRVGRQGLEPRLPGPKPGALTLTPHPVTWTAGDLNAVPPACKAGALPGELAAHDRRSRPPQNASGRGRQLCDPDRAALAFPTLEFSICKRITRSAGPEGFEPPSASDLETGALPFELRPTVFSCANKKPPARAWSWGRCRLVRPVSATSPAPLHPWLPASTGTGRHISRARCLVTRYSTELLMVVRAFDVRTVPSGSTTYFVPAR
jgi:hypothetical protein